MSNFDRDEVTSWERDISELSGLDVNSREFKTTYGNLVSRHWEIGRRPQNDADWLSEYKLLKEAYTYSLRSSMEANKANQGFQLGKRPETSEEVEAEVQLRDTDRRWEVELEDRKHRADLESRDRKHRDDLAANQATLLRRAESIRGWALVAVVVTIVISPWTAIFAGVAPEDFGLYMIPVTGIAGTIIGYWFGQGGRTTAPSNALVHSIDNPAAGGPGRDVPRP